MNETPISPVLDHELSAFVAAVSAAVYAKGQADYPTCELNWSQVKVAGVGPKYAKLIRTRHDGHGNSVNDGVYCFVEMATGNIFKAASYNTPAKGARGNIRVGDASNWFNGALTQYGGAYRR